MTANQPTHITPYRASAAAEAAALSWGLPLTVAGGLIFALTTFSLLSESLLYGLDQLASARFAWLRSQTNPAQVNFLKLLTLLGSDGTAAFALGLIIYNVIRKNTRQLLLLLIGVGGFVLLALTACATPSTAYKNYSVDLQSEPTKTTTTSRGTVFPDQDGQYRFECNPPDHIHMRISAPGYTTIGVNSYHPQGQPSGKLDIVLVPQQP